MSRYRVLGAGRGGGMEDEVDRLVRGGAGRYPMSTSRRSRCCRGWLGWPATWTANARVVFARHDLEIWSFDVLSALRRADAPHHLSPGQLLAQTLVTSGTMTNRIDHLEEAGPRPAPARSHRRPIGPRAAHRGGTRDASTVPSATSSPRENAILGTLDAENAPRWPGSCDGWSPRSTPSKAGSTTLGSCRLPVARSVSPLSWTRTGVATARLPG